MTELGLKTKHRFLSPVFKYQQYAILFDDLDSLEKIAMFTFDHVVHTERVI